EEFNAIGAKADRAGRTVGAFLREIALGNAGLRAQRRPPTDHVLLRQILGQLGKIGSNFNQIAHRLNAGDQPHFPQLKKTLKDRRESRDQILQAVGKDSGPEPCSSRVVAAVDLSSLPDIFSAATPTSLSKSSRTTGPHKT